MTTQLKTTSSKSMNGKLTKAEKSTGRGWNICSRRCVILMKQNYLGLFKKQKSPTTLIIGTTPNASCFTCLTRERKGTETKLKKTLIFRTQTKNSKKNWKRSLVEI